MKTTAKKICILIVVMSVALTLCSCMLLSDDPIRKVESETGIKLPGDITILKNYDDHGGFHGDGVEFIVLTADNEESSEAILAEIKESKWNYIMPDEMYATFFGGTVTIEKQTYETSGYFSDMNIEIPFIENYYYYYIDRYYEQYGEKCSFAPYTQNFTLVIFEPSSSTLYFVAGDS